MCEDNFSITIDGDKFYCLDPIKPNYVYCKCDDDNGIEYLYCCNDQSKNLIHREGGPAIEASNGDLCWYYHGKPHRDDGPAIISYRGWEYWIYHGKHIDCKDNEEFLKIISMKAFI